MPDCIRKNQKKSEKVRKSQKNSEFSKKYAEKIGLG